MTGKRLYGLNLTVIFGLSLTTATSCAGCEKIRVAPPLKVRQ